MEDLIIGSHVSFKKKEQLVGSVMESLSYGANTFMFYTGAPQNTSRSSILAELTTSAQELMKQAGIDLKNVVVHAPYIINLANENNYDFSIRFLKEEIERCEQLGMSLLVLHPGSFVHLTKEEGIKNIIFALNEALKVSENVKICLETMAGKGSEIGSTLDDIKTIIDGVEKKDKILVCLDTCHLNDSGVDLTKFDDFLEEFDRKIGINKIGVVHINDSKNEIGEKKDRHENIGLGTIGFDTLLSIVSHEKLKNVPKILETPYISKDDTSKEKVYPPYKFEIEMFRKKKYNEHLLEDIREFYK